MKHLSTIAGILLGLIFIIFGLNFFLKFIPIPQAPVGSPPAMYMSALYATGYLAFIKVMEILGGVLVAIPKTRNIGLLILGPIIVNILCFHIFLTKGATLIDPMNILISVLALFLLWSERSAWCNLLKCNCRKD
jgi:putative oxidoreductase